MLEKYKATDGDRTHDLPTPGRYRNSVSVLYQLSYGGPELKPMVFLYLSNIMFCSLFLLRARAYYVSWSSKYFVRVNYDA